MKLFKTAMATFITEGVIAIGLWKLGTFPIFLLAISVSHKWGYLSVAAGWLILTWALNFLWLWFFNRKWHPLRWLYRKLRRRNGKP